MYFQINMITEEDGWIVIDTDRSGSGPVRALAKSIAEEYGSEMYQLYDGDAQYMIKKDPYKLLFQYDDIFGTVVVMDKLEDKDAVVKLLQKHFVQLKNM